jgi:hypothetical protein
MHHHLGAGLFGLLFLLIIVAIAIVTFVFWIWMLIDALQNPALNGGEKVAWVLVILFLQILGALIYFFVGRSKRT